MLRAIATHEKASLLSIVAKEITALFSDDLSRNLRYAPVDERFFSAESSLVLAAHTMWSLVPARLFGAMDPDFESLAEDALKTHFGEVPDQELADNLALIFKRLRKFKREGRSATVLNLDRPIHQALLESQRGRCAICNYLFNDDDIYFETELDLPSVAQLRRSMADELTLESYFRRPQLDHIVPVFLGGDSRSNWQIACASCNQGKGTALAWIFRRGWMPSSTLAQLDTLTPSLRYGALARHRAAQGPQPQNELRLFKRDAARLTYLENLLVKDMPAP